MAAWSRKTWKFCEQFLRFFEKNDHYGKIFKLSVLKFYMATLLDVVVKFIRREIGEIVHYFRDKKFRLLL